MSVATVSAEGKPSSRIVLIKQFDERGFTWYTNYQRQGPAARAQPARGPAVLLARAGAAGAHRRHGGETTAAESDEYFSASLQSRSSAIASQQSAPIASRAALESNYEPWPPPSATPSRRARPTGAATACSRNASNSGRAAVRASTTASCTRGADGQWSMQRLQP
jgi:pyridoxamine 5'-phosphate oxidase